MKKSTQFQYNNNALKAKSNEKINKNNNDEDNDNVIENTIINNSDFLIGNTQSMQLNQLEYLNTIKEESFEEGINTQEQEIETINIDNNVNEINDDKFSTPNTKNQSINNLDVKKTLLNTNSEFKDDEPFLPKSKDPHKNTLVLDLDETLVHYVEDSENAFIQVRPGAEDFLEEMANYYEIVIFTAAMQDVRYKYIHNILIVC